MPTSGRLNRGDGVELAWQRQPGEGSTIVFLPGFRSDMGGEKATSLAAFATGRNHAMLRFDYSGHGISGGDFAQGCIGTWTADALAIIDTLTQGKLILVGSSMGGWIALLVALQRAERITGITGIAAAPDFTEALMWSSMTFKERSTLMRDGVFRAPSQYGEPYPITRKLIEDGRNHLLLDKPIAITCAVRLLHGQADLDVPWEMALTLAERLDSQDVAVTLIKDADHRLSRPQDLALLHRTVAALLD
jgi:pimeloyl-ACP methyl ester carboxylesterase